MKAALSRWLRRFTLVTFLTAGAAALSCTKDDSRGQLTVVIQTDLAMPKDVNYVRLEVRIDGLPLGTDRPPPLHRNDYPIDPAAPPELRVTIPATFAVYNDKPTATPVAVRVIAGRDGTPRVLRDAITAVPGDRNAMLRMYLQWLSDGSAVPPPAGAPDPRAATNACPNGQTNIAGACADAHVDVASLPDFDPVQIFGGAAPASGVGFDVLSCFAATQPATPDSQCSFALPSGVAPGSLNVGLELPAGSDGVCNAAHCVIALDRQESPVGPAVGWFVVAGRVQLPAGVCTRLAAVPAAHVVLTSACPAKTAATPSCGPPSAATDCSIHGAQDGAAPSPIVGTASASVLSLGRDHTCVRAQASTSCWGSNAWSQTARGGGGTVPQSAAQMNAFMASVTDVSAGLDSTCVIAGGVYCWGNNRYGERGSAPPMPAADDPSAISMLVPLTDPAAPTIVAVSRAGTESHACASGGGHTRCWGSNSALQLGAAGPNGVSATVLTVDAKALALGDRFTCALDAGGLVGCWGDNTFGQLGVTAGPAQPWMLGQTAGAPRSSDVVAGADFACALGLDANVYCWGNGQSGVPTGTKSPGPHLPSNAGLGTQVQQVAAGTDFACAILKGSPDHVRCWGDNTFGQLGTANKAATSEQPALPVSPPYDELLAGGRRACVRSGHTAACWGSNDYGQIDGIPSVVPVAPRLVSYTGL